MSNQDVSAALHVPAQAASHLLPRGVRLDESAFTARHRVLVAVLIAHVPVLAVIDLLRDGLRAAVLLQLLVVLVSAGAGVLLRGQAACASAVALGLMLSANVLLQVGGGLQDLHIWFFVLLALVSLY